jgi:hypothetical protein
VFEQAGRTMLFLPFDVVWCMVPFVRRHRPLRSGESPYLVALGYALVMSLGARGA